MIVHPVHLIVVYCVSVRYTVPASQAMRTTENGFVDLHLILFIIHRPAAEQDNARTMKRALSVVSKVSPTAL